MKYEITNEQIQQIITNIQEAPAKFTFNALQILMNLKPIVEKKEEQDGKQQNRDI